MFTMGPPLWGGSAVAAAGTNWNPADKDTSVVLSNNNRNATGVVSVRAIASASAGKKYYEIKIVSASGANHPYIGVADITHPLISRIGTSSFAVGYNQNTGSGLIFTNGGLLFGGSVPMYTTNDIIGIAIDIDAGKLWFAKNNTWVNSEGGTVGNPSAGTNQRASPTTGKTYYPAVSAEDWVLQANFADGDFVYAPPTGFVAW